MIRNVSVVVPVFCNESSLRELHDRLTATLRAVTASAYELILVDDASPDGSWEVIESIASVDPAVVGLRLCSNVGQVRAMCAGFEVARGEVLVTMDADLEHPPEAIPLLISAFEGGHELVVGRRIGHAASVVRTAGSVLANLLARAFRLPPMGVGSSFMAGSPRIAMEMRRLVDRTGRQMLLPTVFEMAHDPAVIEVQLSRTSESAYRVRTTLGLGAQLVAAELAPRLARPSLLVGGVLLLAGVRPSLRGRFTALGCSMVAVGVVCLVLPSLFRRDRSTPIFEVAIQVGRGLSDGTSSRLEHHPGVRASS